MTSVYFKMVAAMLIGGAGITVAQADSRVTAVFYPPLTGNPDAKTSDPLDNLFVRVGPEQLPVNGPAMANTLVGTYYTRGRSFAESVGDKWLVTTEMSPADKEGPYFLALLKGRLLVLVSATRVAKVARGKYGYVIRNTLAIASRDGTVQAACSPTDSTSAMVFAMIDPVGSGRMVYAAQIVSGSTDIVEIQAGAGKDYRCRIRIGRNTFKRNLTW